MQGLKAPNGEHFADPSLEEIDLALHTDLHIAQVGDTASVPSSRRSKRATLLSRSASSRAVRKPSGDIGRASLRNVPSGVATIAQHFQCWACIVAVDLTRPVGTHEDESLIYSAASQRDGKLNTSSYYPLQPVHS